MNIVCDQCGEKILPLASYCVYCGAEAPQITQSVLNIEKPSSPVFCPVCSTAVPDDSNFCSSCGSFLFDLPDSDTLYCPYCGEKNRSSAKICAKCGKSLIDWFEMKGTIAETRGIKNNITLFETMNNKYYHFISSKSLIVGSDSDVDIKIDCPWVSGKHAMIDVSALTISDLESSNGTYINRNPNRIQTVNLISVSEFNIAGSFTFLLKKSQNIFAFSLTAILDFMECEKVGNTFSLNELRDHFFILLKGNASLFIRRTDGDIEFKPISSEPYYKISFIDKYFYFFDTLMNTKKLITFKHTLLPVNWKIIGR